MSADTLTVERYNSAFKILFPKKKVQTYGLKDQPMWAWLPKGEGFTGRNGAEIPIKYAPLGGGSHDFNTAQAGKGSSKYTHFQISRVRDYIMISLDNEAVEASAGDNGAYMKATQSEVESAFLRIVQQAAADLQGNGGGSVATVVSVSSGDNYFEVGEHEIGRFEPGMRLQFATTDGTSGTIISTSFSYAKVTSVDHDNLLVYLSDDFDTIASVPVDATTNKYVFPAGNFGLSLDGLQAWLPSDRTTAFLDNEFNGVDRSLFPTRLAGIYFDGSAYGLTECFERASARGKREACTPEVYWINHNRFQDLSLELGAKAEREPAKIGEFAYDRIKMYTGGRQISVMADHNIPDDTCWALTRDSWKFWTLGAAPRFINKQANQNLILEPAADGWEMRVGWYGNVYCDSPGENMRILLPT